MGYRLLTAAIVATHLAFVGYVVFGGFLAWRWPRTFPLHLAAAAWGLTVVAAQLTCPLTALEDWSRRQAGEPGIDGGFIERYVAGIVYPEGYTAVARGVVILAVVFSWAALAARRRRRQPTV